MSGDLQERPASAFLVSSKDCVNSALIGQCSNGIVWLFIRVQHNDKNVLRLDMNPKCFYYSSAGMGRKIHGRWMNNIESPIMNPTLLAGVYIFINFVANMYVLALTSPC